MCETVPLFETNLKPIVTVSMAAQTDTVFTVLVFHVTLHITIYTASSIRSDEGEMFHTVDLLCMCREQMENKTIFFSNFFY